VIWLGQHLLLLFVTYVARTLLLTTWTATNVISSISWETLFSNWLAWDGAVYAKISVTGYSELWTAAFPPLLPLLERMVSASTGLEPQVAGAVIANVAALVLFGLLRVLVEREFGTEVAQRALIYLAVFPTAFFLVAPYSESLFLLFSVAAFLALRQGHWVAAGALAALAALTRQIGILLLAPVLVEYVRRLRQYRQSGAFPPAREGLRMVVGAALPIAALGGFYLYLARQFGTFFAASQAEEAVWGKGLGFPLIGVVRAGGALIDNGSDPNFHQVHILIDVAFTLAAVAFAIAAWRRLPVSYGVYMAAYMLVVVATPLHNWYALMGNPRFVLGAFPVFMLLGLWGERQWVDRLILVVSLPMLSIFTLIFVMQGWVA
jgi:hypothetical protein